MLPLYKSIALLLLVNAIAGLNLAHCQSHYQIRKIVRDAAWLWFNNESAIMVNGSLYIGCEDSMGNSQVVMYSFRNDHDAYSGIDYNLSTWEAKRRRYPTHNYPSLIKTDEGTILAVYHNSSNQMFYRTGKIVDAGKLTQHMDWSDESVIRLNSGMNYSNLCQLSAEKRICNFFSIYKQSPCMVQSADNGKTWRDETVFMRQGSSGTSPYMRLSGNCTDRIDILYTDGHPRTALNNNIYHLYYKNRKFFRSDGTLISSLKAVKKRPLAPESGTLLYNGSNSHPGWVWDIEYDPTKNPIAVFISSADGLEGNDLRYHYARWDATKQQFAVSQIAYAGTHLYVPENHFAGGITIDPENPDVVYISANVDPETGKSGSDERYQIYRGVTSDEGKSWEWEKLTFDRDRDNLRPIVPHGHGYSTFVIWYSQLKSTRRAFDSEILGIFEK